MTGVNSHDSGEENINISASDTTSKYDKLIKSYVWSKLSVKPERLSFAKKIQNTQSVPANILSEIEEYAGNSSEFSGTDINTDTVKINSLQREVWSFLVWIKSQQTSLRSIFLQEYDITAWEYTKYISGKVDDISSETELKTLLDSDILRDEFLHSIYKKSIPKRRLVSHILQDMKIQERYDTLEPHLKQEFIDTVAKFQRREALEISDIMPLFESDALNSKEKQRIIETFMPSISISEAIKLNVLGVKRANEIKKQALEGALDTSIFSRVNVDSYLSGINDDDLIISTQWLFESAKSQEKLFEQNFFFEKFKQDFDAMLKKIEEDLASKSIQTSVEMKEILSGVNHILWINHLKEGSTFIIKQNQKDESWSTQEVTLYAEIVSLASAGTFIIQERWVNEYTRNIDSTSRQTYSQFIDYATKWEIPNSIEFITSDTLHHRIKTGEIKDINNNGVFGDRSEIDLEIKDITTQIEHRERELRKQKIPKSEWKNDEELKNLYKIKDEKNILRDNVKEDNKKTLSYQIDEIDPTWKKFELKKGTNFVTNGWNGDVFSVTDIDEVNQVITVRGLQNNEPISYTQFIESFKSQNAIRVSKIDNFKELFTQWDDAYKSWQDFELQDWKVKNKNSKLKIDYNYLVPDKDSKNQELLKIHSIDDTMVTLSFWEAKSVNSTDKKGDKKEWEIFQTENKKYTVSIGVLDHYIRQNNLSFRSLQEGKISEEEIKGIPKPKEESKFWNWFFQWMSIAAAVKWSTTAIEQITNILNEWDEDKANQFALKIFGPLLGADGKTDLQSRVEQTQKKNSDEFVQRLKDINSHPATKLIESWMKDPRTPEYKKEAGMFYMFEKYGALCAKELYKYQWQYFWYQQMWGRIWDSVWVETHAKNNRDPKQNTTEEQLVYNLMSEQVKDSWYGGIKRRSKLAKELKALRGKGKEEEYDTGVKDGGNERSVQDRLDGGMSELSSGNYPNAFWWLETVINKGGTMKEMNMIPFVAVFSGMAYNFEKDILDKIKNFPGESRMIMILRMMSYAWDIDLLNNTIMEACKNLQSDPKYAGILPKAQAIFGNQKDKSVSEKDKQKATIAFYEEYGEVLTNILYMLNTWKDEDTHNKMIFFEKDTNSTFSQYYEKIQWYVNADGDFGKNEGLMADAFAGAGTSWIDIYRATTHLLEFRTWGTWAKHEAGPIMWKEIVHEFEAIPNRKYSDDPIKNKKMQEKLLESNLRKFLAAVMKLYSEPRSLSWYNSPTGPFTQLNKWGIYFDKMIDAWATSDSVKTWWNQSLIQWFVHNIMNSTLGGVDYTRATKSKEWWGYEYIEEGEESNVTSTVSDLIQGKAMNTLTKKPIPAWLSDIASNDNYDETQELNQAA